MLSAWRAGSANGPKPSTIKRRSFSRRRARVKSFGAAFHPQPPLPRHGQRAALWLGRSRSAPVRVGDAARRTRWFRRSEEAGDVRKCPKMSRQKKNAMLPRASSAGALHAKMSSRRCPRRGCRKRQPLWDEICQIEPNRRYGRTKSRRSGALAFRDVRPTAPRLSRRAGRGTSGSPSGRRSPQVRAGRSCWSCGSAIPRAHR